MEVAVTATTLGTCVYVTVNEHDTVGTMRKQVASELGVGEAFVQLILEEPDVQDDEMAAGYIASGEVGAVVLHQKADAKEVLRENSISLSMSGLTYVLNNNSLGQHVATLHEAGVDVFALEYATQHPLIIRAVQSGNLEALKATIGIGGNLGLMTHDNGYTPYHVATSQVDTGCLEYLLSLPEAVHFINMRSTAGFTPLHCAASYNNPAAIEVLVRHGAHIDSRTPSQMTPLFSACHGGFEAAQKLLDLGAYLHAKDNRGFTVLHMKCRPELVDLFTSRGLSINSLSSSKCTPLHSNLHHIAPLNSLWHYVQKGANLNLRNQQGQTPLHFAVLRVPQSVPSLLENGASPGIRDNEGKLALHHCAAGGNISACRRLVKASADIINTRDNEGRTPLHYAKSDVAAQCLLGEGADPGLIDRSGQTPAFGKSAKIRRTLFDSGCERGVVDVYGFKAEQKVSAFEKHRREKSMPWLRKLELSELN